MREPAKKIDRRVVKTKKAIHNAFAKLLTEKELNDITISDIAELADINRKTFYNYYAGIYGSSTRSRTESCRLCVTRSTARTSARR